MNLRDALADPSVVVAPRLLGAILVSGPVALRITEVEAYLGADDPGSHAFRGQTRRNGTMFGEPGHLYTYFTYGMHVCANVVCSPEGVASAVLLRAGEIVEGLDVARERRHTSRTDADLARGPARLAVALGITLADDGVDLVGGGAGHPGPESRGLVLEGLGAPVAFETSARTGVSGPGGTADFPWRYWIAGDPTVSPYRAHVPRAPRIKP